MYSTLSGCGCVRDGLDKEGGAFFPIVYTYIHPTPSQTEGEEDKEEGHPAILQSDNVPAGTAGMLPDNAAENTSRLLTPDDHSSDIS